MGYPVSYITENSHIAAVLSGIVCSHFLLPLDNADKIVQIHKMFNKNVIERGTPGEIRSFSHSSPSGVRYSEPSDILANLNSCMKIKNRPVIKHIFYEWVHPFSDGNGRSGRIILASDLGYNFDILNQVIDENYIPMLSNFMNEHDMSQLLSGE